MQGAGYRVQGSGFRVQGSGFRVESLDLVSVEVVERDRDNVVRLGNRERAWGAGSI